MDIPCR